VPEDLTYKSIFCKFMSEHTQARKRMQDLLKKNLPVVSEMEVWLPNKTTKSRT
jgi:hypothetical protein